MQEEPAPPAGADVVRPCNMAPHPTPSHPVAAVLAGPGPHQTSLKQEMGKRKEIKGSPGISLKGYMEAAMWLLQACREG